MTAQVVRTAELRGVLAHLDEVLTMSARMAAVTGDPRWRERYDLFIPRLDRAIAHAMELSPPAGRRRIDEAVNLSSHALLSLEEAALEAVSTGGPGATAAAPLDGEGYEDRHEGAYNHGLSALTGHMNALLAARREAVSRSAARDAAIALLGGLAIAGAWAHVAAVLRRWRRTLTAGEEARFRRLSDAAFEGILIHDQGRILGANQAYADMIGAHSAAETRGTSPLDGVAPECRDLVRERIRLGAEQPYEAAHVRRDGRASWRRFARGRCGTPGAWFGWWRCATSPSGGKRRSASVTWPTTTRSPACPTAPCSSTA